MRKLPVELLHAKSLPWDLLRLSAMFSDDDPLVRRAASHHLRHALDQLDFIGGVDFSGLLAEYEYWLDLVRRQFEPGVRGRIDGDRLKLVERKRWRYEKSYDLLNDAFFSLVALGLLCSGFSHEQIIALLAGQSWATKHEILARWGWMIAQRDLLRQRGSLPAPYFCSLAPKGQGGEICDKEFYQLLHFLHHLRAQAGQELLFWKKGENPDFKLKDPTGKEIGAEMTDVHISQEWYEEQDAAEVVSEAIRLQFADQFVHIHVKEPNSWRALADHLDEIRTWLSSELTRLGTIKGDVSLKHNSLGLNLDLRPAAFKAGIAWGSSDLPTGDDYIRANSRTMLVTLRQKLEDKLARKGRPRDTPSVRPCHLVIYPFHFDADLEQVVREYFEKPPVDMRTHFDHIWLSSESEFIQLA